MYNNYTADSIQNIAAAAARESRRLQMKRDMRKKREIMKRKQRNSLVRMAAKVALIVFLIIFGATSCEEYAVGDDGFRRGSGENLPVFNIIDAYEPIANGRRIVVIDPGHGGDDPGAVHGGISEKDLNLSVALMVRDYLEELGYAVIMTRESDVTLSLQERATIAEDSKADAFISIHHNALDNDTVTEGLETWYNGETNELNAVLAGYIQNETARITEAGDRGLRNSDRLILLRKLSMPSCLVEVGFLSSVQERERLVCPDYQDKVARGIVNGIAEFFSGFSERVQFSQKSPAQYPEINRLSRETEKEIEYTDGSQSQNQKMIALTFDDGPSRYTQQLLDLLAEHDSTATFFILGDRIAPSNHQTIINAVGQGSEVAGHTWSHRVLASLSSKEMKHEIQSANDAIFEITGILPRFFRPPFGLFNDTLKDISREMGLALINWNIDPEDWRFREADKIYNHIMTNARDGGIVLLHDIYESTLEAMRLAIPALVNAGYRLVTVSELLGDTAPGNVYFNR